MSGSNAHKAPSKIHIDLNTESPTLYHHDSLLRKSDHSRSALAPAGVRIITSVDTKRPLPKTFLASDKSPASRSSVTTRCSSCERVWISGSTSTEAFRKTATYPFKVTGLRLRFKVSEALLPVAGVLIGCVLSFMIGWWI